VFFSTHAVGVPYCALKVSANSYISLAEAVFVIIHSVAEW